MSENASPQISPEMVEMLRCPVAVQQKDAGENRGRLRLVRGYWLVSEDSGNKYPIHNGIPVMLVSEGEKWKHTPESELPVPPPTPENPIKQM